MRADLPRGTVTLALHGHRGLDTAAAQPRPGRVRRRTRGAQACASRCVRRAWWRRGRHPGRCVLRRVPDGARAQQRQPRSQPTVALARRADLACAWACTPATPTVTSEGYVGVDVHRGARVAALAHGGQIVLSPATAALLDGETLRDLGAPPAEGLRGLRRGSTSSVPSDVPAASHAGQRRPADPGDPLPRPRAASSSRRSRSCTSATRGYSRSSARAARGRRASLSSSPACSPRTRRAGRSSARSHHFATPDLVLPTIAERLGRRPRAEVDAIAARVGEKRTHVVVRQPRAPAARRRAAARRAHRRPRPRCGSSTTSREAAAHPGRVRARSAPARGRARRWRSSCDARTGGPSRPRGRRRRRRALRAPRPTSARARARRRADEAPRPGGSPRSGSSERLDLLKGTRDADERHATLRATIAWSHDLLDEDEQRLFRRLAVFRGGCTLETAEAVCDADLDTLASLLDKSLVRRRTGRLGEERYWMLETIREFAAERLEESIDADATRRRHAERMLEIAQLGSSERGRRRAVRLADRAWPSATTCDVALDWAAENDIELATRARSSLSSTSGTRTLTRGRAAPDGSSCSRRAGEASRLRYGRERSACAAGALHISGRLRVLRRRVRGEPGCSFASIGDERGIVASDAPPGKQRVSAKESTSAPRATRSGVARALAEGRFPLRRRAEQHGPGASAASRWARLTLEQSSSGRAARIGSRPRVGLVARRPTRVLAHFDRDRSRRPRRGRAGQSRRCCSSFGQEENAVPAASLPLTTLARVALERRRPSARRTFFGEHVEAERERAQPAWEHARVGAGRTAARLRQVAPSSSPAFEAWTPARPLGRRRDRARRGVE